MRRFLQNGSLLLLRRQTDILSAAAVIMVTYALSHLIGLFKTRLLISYFFGHTAHLLDVYYAAFVIPDTVFQLLVVGSLSAAFIPVFSRYLIRQESQAWEIAASVLNLVLLVFTLIAILVFIFSGPLSRLIAPGFGSDQILTLSHLMRLMLVAQLFFCISGFLTATIQSHQRFLLPALAPIIYNLGIIFGTVFLSSPLGIYGPALGTVIGAILHMTIQIPLALRLGFQPRFTLSLSHAGVREIMRLMPPRALALGVDQIEQLITVILASLLAAGSLSVFNVARLLYVIPSSLFGVAIGQAAFPTLSRQSTAADTHRFNRTLIDSLLQITFLALPLSILFIVLRIPIVRLVFGAKSFPWTATLLTGKVLAILSLSAAFAAIHQLLSRAFYALHDTRTPLFTGLAAAVFHTFTAVLAVGVFGWGITGLAAVLSAVTISESILLFFIITRRLHLEIHNSLLPLSKMIIAAAITGISLWLPMRLLDQFVFDTTRTLPLLALTAITSLIGLVTYFYLSFFFHVEELKTFSLLLARLGRWRKYLTPPRTAEPLISSDQP